MTTGKTRGQTHEVVADDVTAGQVVFHFGDFMQVKGAQVQVRTAAGVSVAWDGAVTVAAETVTVDNAGTTDFAAGNTITVTAHG